MSEARRGSQDTGPAAAGGAAAGLPLPSDQAQFLQGLSAWSDAHIWEPPPAEPRAVPASEVMVYLVDTSNLWNVVGGVSEEGMTQLIAHADSAPAALYQMAPGLAGMAVRKASSTGARLSDSACQNALTFASFYLACTETRTEVSTTGSLRGHWLVLLYHLRDGSTQLRPVFSRATAACKFGAESFVGAVLDVVVKDLHGGVSQVSKQVQAAGGLRLAEPLRARIARKAQ